MEKTVKFEDLMEQQADDHTNIQAFVRQSIDHIVSDAVTRTRRFIGFNVAKTGQAEVTIAAGRFYDVNGAVFVRASSTVQSLIPKLPITAKKYISITAHGVETETDVEERDFLVDVETGRTEPDAVAMHASRDAVLDIAEGSETADPNPPAIPIGDVEVARVLLDTSGVVAITMMVQNRVASTEDLNARADLIDAWKGIIEPRVSSLGSDLAALAAELRRKSTQNDMTRIYRDLARVKERVNLPSSYSDWGADHFLDETDTDAENEQNLGHSAWTQEGIRFPDDNADEFELALFSSNDPNASLQNGILLPAYDSVFKMGIYPYTSEVGIAQYGFQSIDLIQKQIARKRLRYGQIFTVCTNAAWYRSGVFDPATMLFRIGNEVFNVLDMPDLAGGWAHFPRMQQVWEDNYVEEYWEYVVTEHHISGALVAQTLLNSNDTWLTRIGFYVKEKAANENVHLAIVECTGGVPDLDKAILKQTVNHADLISGDWTRINTVPTFLKAGKRYAIVLVSNANHKIGMATGQSYLDGSFFYSTDGAWFQGDLTKDMMLELYGAKFRAPQVTIELGAWNLDGGIRNIDILAGTIAPESTQLIYEVLPTNGTNWIALTTDDLSAFNAAPPLCRARVRFVGTRDVMPGLVITGSRCKLSRPKTAFTHISKQQTLAAPTTSVTVECLLESFDETPHDLDVRLRVGSAWETPDATVTEVESVAEGRYIRRFTFETAQAFSAFTIETKGTTNSAGNTFHVAERIHWST
jgi:hypothetical protein